MTTENDEIQVDRNLNELLALESYQDMTDTEIESIIDYKIKVAVNAALGDAETEARMAAINQIVADSLDHHNQLMAVVESVMNKVHGIPLELVSYE